MSLKEVFYMSLLCFASIAAIMIIVSFATNDSGFSDGLGVHPIIAYFGLFVSIFVIILFFFSLGYLVESIRFAKKFTWQHLVITPQGITLQKSDGAETVINQSEILSIYLQDYKETKELIESRMRPLWHDIKLDVLKIKLHRKDYCIILEAYNDAKQIVTEFNDLHPIEDLAEYLQKSADEFAEQNND